MQDFYRIELAAIENFDIAVAHFDRDGVLTYLNAAGRKLFGLTTSERVDLNMLFPDPAEHALVTQQLKNRQDGKSSAYTTSFRRLGESIHQSIPVRIYAFPDSDVEGNVTGSVALIHDLREKRARAGIHAAIESSEDNEQLLAALAKQLRTLFEFDEFRMTIFSESNVHLRTLYSSDARRGDRHPFRWWPIPPFMEKVLTERRTRVREMEVIVADPDYAELRRTDPVFSAFCASGVRQILSVPIIQDNRIIAILGFDSRQPGRYTQDTVELLAQLPVAEVAKAAVHREQLNRQQAVFDLVRRLGRMEGNVKPVAEELVTCLVGYFGWDHVSIFQREDGADRLVLLVQANINGTFLPEDSTIPCTNSRLAEGEPGSALARAASNNKVINETATRRWGAFAGSSGFTGTGSELAIPISGGKTTWVLNVESRLTNAFAAEEIESLVLLAKEVGTVLHRSALFELTTTVLRSINDAVIETNTAGDIRWFNPAAAGMLGLDTGVRIKMLDLVTDSVLRRELAFGGNFCHRELELRRNDNGREVFVLLSASDLPSHLGGRVFVASDVTAQKELQRLTELKEVFKQAAMEGRVPLSLASIWLQQRAADGSPGSSTPDITAILHQLARADLPLERLMRLFTPRPNATVQPTVDLGRVVELTLRELPQSLVARIEISRPGEALLVHAEFNELKFCVESMVSFGLRTQPQSQHLHVALAKQDGRATLRVEGNWAVDVGNASDEDATDRWRRKTLTDLTLGESVIQRVVEGSGGTYSCELRKGLKLKIELPLKN